MSDAHDLAAFAGRLRAEVRGDVGVDPGTRALYTMDASNHRRVPQAVVRPRDEEDVVIALALAREHGVPVVPRGAGTSIAGQATGLGMVLDFSRYLDQIGEVDPERRLVSVRPGAVLDQVRAAAAPHGLTFGPDPSTHSRCTIGGMIGNNSCGSHSVAWGKTDANVESLDVLLADGTRMTVRSPGRGAPRSELVGRRDLPGREGEIYRELHTLADDNLSVIRRGFASPEGTTMTRRVSGYSLDALLPEHGLDVTRALVGTEGSCVVVLGATVRLVEVPNHRALVVAGFPDEYSAADAVPALLPHRPMTVESLSPELLDLAGRGAAASRVDQLRGMLPKGGSWLLMEVGGASRDEAVEAAEALGEQVRRGDPRAGARVVVEPAAQRLLWRVREDAAGSATRLADGSEAWPGWEDAAVPVERLGDYLRGFRALMAERGVAGLPYGHFGEGCVHVRLGVDLSSREGIAEYREFLDRATDLVVSYGGSLSGEHGDGLARSEYLAKMYGDEVVSLFGQFKRIWDPDNLLNPGVVVRPAPLEQSLRFPVGPAPATSLALARDGGSFTRAVRRCVGVGRCVQHGAQAKDASMCPSFQVTRDERHSTRGRAHLLVEMAHGDVIADGWRSTEVRDALDLCLSCRACVNECPVDVDMASYKAEFLYHHYAGRLRPAAHYTMGWLPVLARLASTAPQFANLLAGNRAVGPLLKRLGGVEPRRAAPEFAATTLRRALRRRGIHPAARGEGRLGSVMLWPDTFTSYFAPEVGVAAVRVLQDAGFGVRLPKGPVCCGLTWVSTGQLDIARRVARRSLEALRPALEGGVPIVALEPSCATALRTDVPELLDTPSSGSGLPADPKLLAERVVSLSGLLAERAPDWRPPVEERSAVGQVHCHQRATVGYDDEQRLLAAAGVDLSLPQASCCGLAGNFGMERGHYEVSVACAEQALAPAVREASEDTLVVADGFSCRLQIAELTGRRAVHSAQVLAARL